MRGKRIRTAVFGAVIGLMSVAGCATSRTDFVVALPNGYQIIRDKTSAPTIIKRSGGVVVPGPVTDYAVVRDVVVGVVQPTAADGKRTRTASSNAEAPKAYFVLNTRTGEVGKGLSESDYNQRLKTLNITSEPYLSPPVLPE